MTHRVGMLVEKNAGKKEKKEGRKMEKGPNLLKMNRIEKVMYLTLF